MSQDTAPPTDTRDEKQQPDPFEPTRMSFGDHLEELRGCLIRALLGVVLGAIVALVYGKQILLLVCRPLLIAQQANGLEPSLQLLAPTAGFTAYLKISVLTGLMLTAPWVLYQIWNFIGTGLYPRERRFARRLIVPSIVLFASGVMFLYFLALPFVLHFFIQFNEAFGVPELSEPSFQAWLLPEPDRPPPSAATELGHIPFVDEPPENPQPGDAWIETGKSRLMIQTPNPGERWSVSLRQRSDAPAMQSQFALDMYVSFVLLLALAFGIAFETPIVVFFLAWTGIVPAATMANGRRYVILGIAILAAILTPPDPISLTLLALPMYVLFEIGIVVARFTERKSKA